LRGTTLVAAPLFLLGAMGGALAVATALWGAWHADDRGTPFILVLTGSLIVGAAGFAAARGCFVESSPTGVRDVVAWVTVRRFASENVIEARVRAGAWRWFEVELADGRLVTLLGASPAQFPARLLPGAQEQDLSDLAALRGEPLPR
jgi:hypothetical protein